MLTLKKAATMGAGPATAISADPGFQVACKPADVSDRTAVLTAAGSGPNRAAYWSGVTVWPDAMSMASWSGCLTLRPRLRSIWVADPALPMCVAWEIAVASNGVGGLMLLARACVDPADGWGLHAAATTITRAVSAPWNRIVTEG